MDYDELLTWVKVEKKIACESYAKRNEVTPCDRCNLCQGFRMLIAVIELHKPIDWTVAPTVRCSCCSFAYPCPTMQAIEKELA
jgi:hypothetical protein